MSAKAPLQMPNSDPLQHHIITRHSHTSRDGDLTTQKTAPPDSTKGVCVSVGAEGKRDCLPSPGECALLRLAVGQRRWHLLLSCQGTSLQRLPWDPCKGVKRASQKEPVHGILLQTGPPWRRSCLPMCGEVSSTLGGATVGLRCQDPAGAAPHRVPAQGWDSAPSFYVPQWRGHCLQAALLVTTVHKALSS